MPELPEVESVCRSLAGRLVGRRVVDVTVNRRSVVHGSAKPARLLRGMVVTGIERHGKQMALCAGARDHTHTSGGGPCVCIHLGMSGTLRHVAGDAKNTPHAQDKHTHVIWRLDDASRVQFRDPRRFGGLWAFDSKAALLEHRWGVLGPDALRATPTQLHHKLKHTHRPIKSALLDQHVVAGLGNIYVDELLFTCGLHPLTPGNGLGFETTQRLVRRMRSLLARAIRTGGSTLRDYQDAAGAPGQFQTQHRVYGRQGRPCAVCSGELVSLLVAGRTTVCCLRCQPLSRLMLC